MPLFYTMWTGILLLVIRLSIDESKPYVISHMIDVVTWPEIATGWQNTTSGHWSCTVGFCKTLSPDFDLILYYRQGPMHKFATSALFKPLPPHPYFAMPYHARYSAMFPHPLVRHDCQLQTSRQNSQQGQQQRGHQTYYYCETSKETSTEEEPISLCVGSF